MNLRSQIVGATLYGTITNEEGDYELDVIHPGNLVLHFAFDADRTSRARRQVLLRKGKTLRVDMQLDGRLCGPGSYGHLNGCRYLLLVNNVLEYEEEAV